MAKVLPIISEGKTIGYCLKCPACGHAHKFCTAEAHTEGWPVWILTGMPNKPTIRDSLLYTWEEGPEHIPMRCHCFVTDGRIDYCGDSTHAMAGKTVELPDFE